MEGAHSASDQGLGLQLMKWIGLSSLLVALPALVCKFLVYQEATDIASRALRLHFHKNDLSNIL